MKSKNSNPKFTGERQIFHYTFLFDAYGNTKSNVVAGDNNRVIINEADWKMIQDELIKVYRKLPQSSEEYNASEKALNYALNRDEKGFKAVLKEYAKSFTSDLFSGVASGVLVNLLSKLI